MTEGYGIALITVLGAIATAVITAVFARSRVGRLEAISRILKDLPVHDPAYADLAQIRQEDARALRRAQQYPWPPLVGFVLATLLLGSVLSEFGEPIREWSDGLYNVLVGAVLGSFLGTALLVLAFLVLGTVWLGMRVFGWLGNGSGRLRSARTRRQTQPAQRD
ncbi:hypothetical protein [Antiquaquibacter soli]|uniref:MotA/TolQ/ExbB proton channel domain-containing protein n=1 Tax=Antiquaquibacter soli TaxID=3064523 RepID=A0ABT9BUU8_9MICO|nr:hypothetical protein [Protaetiibacter sp. WY-16]MDO7883122.1 hypothetical protein [Protaetiibacter sp. WY-16]